MAMTTSSSSRGRMENWHRPAVDSPASYGIGTLFSHVNKPGSSTAFTVKLISSTAFTVS